MNYPNFFLIGAPKSGTTSLYNYLSAHPDVFMPRLKGPHFYATDIDGYRSIKNKKEYLDLFVGVDKNAKMIGEASVLYLYSTDAIKNIKRNFPNSKIIVLIRNPIELIHSWHNELIWSCKEDIEDLERAIGSEKERMKGYKLPNNCVEPKIYFYSKIGLLGEQIYRLNKFFPQSQIKIILFEDFIRSTENVYNEVIKFLNLPKHHKNNFIIYNRFKRIRFKWLQKFLTHPPSYLLYTLKIFKKVTRIKRLGIFDYILSFNKKEKQKPEIHERTKFLLKSIYQDDITKLSKIIDRDLTHWIDF